MINIASALLNNKYNIKDTDIFNIGNYSQVEYELNLIKRTSSLFITADKPDIIISLLKDHSIKKVWLSENPQLVNLITCGATPTKHIEMLFESCRSNKGFLKGYEDYIRSSQQ